MCVKPGVLQEVTSSCFKHIDKPVHSHIPFYGAVYSTVEGDKGTGPSIYTDGNTLLRKGNLPRILQAVM